MKRLVIATVLLFAATVLVTFVYFRHLNRSVNNANLVLRSIPNDASVIFEFSNDRDFYEIFAGNKLFGSLIGQQKQDELLELKKLLLQNQLLQKLFTNRDIFISLLPQKGNTLDFLLTASVNKDFQEDVLEQLTKQSQNGILVTAISIAGKPGYQVYLNDLKKRFYLISKDDFSISGSFSKEVIEACARFDYRKEKLALVLLPDQQRSNSLANLYINYRALNTISGQLFQAKNPDIFRTFREMPASAALSLDYKSDALIFNGITQTQANLPPGYLDVFEDQQPVINRLKEIFPSTTAYFTNFSLSDPVKFENRLASNQLKSSFAAEQENILKKVKNETGIRLQKEFSHLLGNEFAIISTQYREKIGIVQIKDGLKALALITNLSKMTSESTGQLNYEKLPQILLGDAFSNFKRPFFRVIDNYLILTNSESELASYNDSYINRKFLPKTDGFNDFNNLMAEKSNIAFVVRFKNAASLFKQDMRPSFYDDFSKTEPGWKNFYGASWQLSVSEKNYYTNFCVRLNTDTTIKNLPF